MLLSFRNNEVIVIFAVIFAIIFAIFIFAMCICYKNLLHFKFKVKCVLLYSLATTTICEIVMVTRY